MSTMIGGSYPRTITLVRHVPMPGEPGCVGACPLCTVKGKQVPPCLACRDELRARLDDMQLAFYVEKAMN